MFCKNCGKPNDLGTTFCVNCGAKINNTNNNYQSTNSNVQNINAKFIDRKKTVLIVGLVVVFFAYFVYVKYSLDSQKSGNNELYTLNEQEKKMIKYMNDKYKGKEFIKDKRTKGYCPDDPSYDACSMHVYEKSTPNHVFQISNIPSTGELTYNGYAKNVIEDQLAPKEIEKAFEPYNIPLTANIEFYQNSGSNLFDDSSLENFIKKHNPKSWMIWMTLTVDDLDLVTEDLITEAFTNLYKKLSGTVGFRVNIKYNESVKQDAFEGEISQNGIKYFD